MSDKFQSVTVVLDNERDIEALQPILDAIRMVRGVVGAHPGKPMDADAYFARETTLSNFVSELVAFAFLARRGGEPYRRLQMALTAERAGAFVSDTMRGAGS